MSLTVTVQKGHDFSSGNVTRAALNAGAVPTVSVTGAVGTTELVDGAITDAQVGTTAGILLSKLSGQTADDILVVSATAGNPTGTKEIKALPGYLSGAIKEVSNKVEITPSDKTIVADKLVTTTDDNLILGLATELTTISIDDYVMVHDTSATTDGEVRLKKAKVNTLQNVGTTQYVGSNITVTGSSPSYTVPVDMDGAPFQSVELTDIYGFYNFTFANRPVDGGTAIKTITVRVKNTTGTTINYGVQNGADWPTSFNWPEVASNNGPPNIAAGKVALIGVTFFGGGDADCVAAYAVTN
jgi:hypothetical protein